MKAQRGKSHRAHADSLAIDLDLQLLPAHAEYLQYIQYGAYLLPQPLDKPWS